MRRRPGVLALCIASYLYGSIPVVHWLAREQHADLKRLGSGNVGATNLLSATSPRIAVAGWLFDASKGGVPVLVARALGYSDRATGLAGVCGMVGQCWPVTLGFSGGRGISTFVGTALALDPRGGWLGVLPLAGGGVWRLAFTRLPGGQQLSLRGDRSRSLPLGTLIAVLGFALGGLLGRVRGGALPPLLFASLVLVRRLTAPMPDDAEEGPSVNPRAYLYRLLYDRNTAW